jgi:peptide/nickel transport system substrate-binding protein
MTRIALFLLVCTVMLLAACGPTGAPPAGPTAAPASVSTSGAAPTATSAPAVPGPTTAKPAAGGGARGQGPMLKILYWQAPTILNTHLAQGTKDYDAGRLVLEPLASFGPDGNPVPNLAAEIPTRDNGGVSQDLRSVTWKLKQGVKWSDRTDFTADDVVFTFQYMADPKTAASDSFAAEGVAGVEAKDKYTVVVTFQNPNPNYYQIFVGGFGNILQKKQFENYTGENAANAPGNMAPIGTGPYKVSDFKPGDVVSYEINDQYREPNKPFFKQVQIKGGGDAASAARAVFQTGEVDYAWNLQVEAQVLNQLSSGGKADLVTAVSPNVERLMINFADPNKDENGARAEPDTRHPFFSDINVRKAFAMAVDRKQIADRLYGPAGQPTCNIVTAPQDVDSSNTASLDVCRFDVARANQLLDQAGWTRGSDGMRQKNGVAMKVLFQTSVNPLRQKEQDIVKASWEQLGVSVELKAVDAGVFFSSDAGNPDTASHFYADVEMFTNGSTGPDQTNYLSNWTTQRIAQQSNQWRANNYNRYSNPEYDQLWQQYQSNPDQAERREIAIKMNDILVSDVVVIPLVARTQPTDGVSKQLKGIKPDPWDSVLWNLADWTKA